MKKDKYYIKKYGKKRIHVWSSKKAAQSEMKNLRQRGYKVKLAPDKKSIIIIGKTTRGAERDRFGKRLMMSPTMRQSTLMGIPRPKPYFTSHTFRQPCFTLRKFGWAR